jgi:crotonobetainyl-CoA:carnitine CoA-transferase CaiB-like acyl-CoA transferase
MIPLDMRGRKPAIRRQPPVLGADTRAVLAEAGYSSREIERFIEERIAVAAD